MFGLFKKKTKTPEQEEADKAAEKVRFEAEQERRLELAKEHGKADAEKKYAKFKKPSMFNSFGSLASNLSNPDMRKRFKQMEKDLEEL